MADGIDLLRKKSYTSRQLIDQFRVITRSLVGQPILVEEFIKPEGNESSLSTEYKVHVFGDRIGAIQVIHRKDNFQAKHRYYTPEWQFFDDPMSTILPLDGYTEPPCCLDDMLACARRLGKAWGTYVRADFYVYGAGCVFGEFSSTPSLGESFTPYADQHFGTLWRETFGDKL